VRTLTAPLSAVFLILIAGLAFTQLQAKTEYPPPILDPEFGLWVSDPALGGKKPMVWDLEYEKGNGDQILMQETVIADEESLRLQIIKNGPDVGWTYIRLGQTIDGNRLRAFLDEEVGIWVFLDTTCACNNRTLSDMISVFGVEINDGTHVIDFVFDQTTAKTNETPMRQTVILNTPIGKWTHHSISIIERYSDAKWKLPDRISLSIVFGIKGLTSGYHAGYVHGFSITKETKSTQPEQLRPNTHSPLKLQIRSSDDQLMALSKIVCLPHRIWEPT
jgi:hypothetical protein